MTESKAEDHAHEATALIHDHGHEHDSVRRLDEDVPFYARPMQRQRWDDVQVLPHINWGDLFFDLFYVSAAFNLAASFKESVDLIGLLYFVGCYLTVFSIWGEKVGYDAKYCPPDNLFHRLIEAIHLMVLGTVVSHIRPASEMRDTHNHTTGWVFSVSVFVESLIVLYRAHDVYTHVLGGPEAKEDASHDIRRRSVASVLYFAAAIIATYDLFFRMDGDSHNDIPIILCGSGYMAMQVASLVEVFVWIPKRGVSHKELRVPLNLDFVLHRLGEWVMLMLGESVLALLIVEASPGRRYYVTFYAGIASVTLFQYLFFRTQPFHADDHAMRRSQIGGISFYYSMLVYSASLILVGCAYKMILHEYLDEYEEAEEIALHGWEPEHDEEVSEGFSNEHQRIANLFSWSMAASFFSLDYMIVTHRGWTANLKRLYHDGHWDATGVTLTVLSLGLLITAGTLSCWVTDFEALSILGFSVVMLQVLLRTIGLRYFPVSKKAMQNLHDQLEQKRWPNVSQPRAMSPPTTSSS